MTSACQIAALCAPPKTRHHHGPWNGGGAGPAIVSGVSASSPAVDGIGYGTAAQLGIGAINGIPVSGTDIVLEHTLLGDANYSKSVDIVDFGRLRANFGQAGRTFAQGDFNYTGTVDIADFGILRGNFGLSLGSGGNLFRDGNGEGDGDGDKGGDLPTL